MRYLFLFFLSLATTIAAEKSAPTKNRAEDTVFRKPFTLTLHIDAENFYEAKLYKIPFVHQNDVYLFKGDELGITFEIRDNTIKAVKYQPDILKAAVTLKFTQEVKTNGTAMMMLVIRNRTEKKLNMDALMTVPEKEGVAKTTILPIGPGLSNYESWPHPIVQLVLRNMRIEKESGSK